MKTVIKIDGMKCMHCVSAVEKALNEMDGVSKVEVLLDEGIAKVEFDENTVCVADLEEAIEDQGFDVVNLK